MYSIIIPAHNEADVITRGLRALTEGAHPGELEVIVVANGCSDDTAGQVRAFGHPDVRLIETEVGSKTHALNLGDAAAKGFPRLYVDADVVLTLDSVRRVVRCLGSSPALAASPQTKLDLAGCDWSVRAFYDVDRRLPSSRHGIGGSGVYALGEEGRRRFDTFPAITADDAFVRLQFAPEERTVVEGAWSIVAPPRTLDRLVSVMTRVHFGNYELEQLAPRLWDNNGTGNKGTLLALACRPWLWPKLAVYLYVKSVAKTRGRRRYHGKLRSTWDRDQTTRKSHGPDNVSATGERLFVAHASDRGTANSRVS